MGTDNLFHKRKARQARDLSQRKAKRATYAKVLIVCEGSKTEPGYFNGLKNYYELNSANVEIAGDSGSSPLSIWEYARNRYNNEKNAGDPFDKVYCVFDRDNHASYDEVCYRIKNAAPKETFHAITSVPCFEYWLLLHFNYTTSPYRDLPDNSAANQVLEKLRSYLPYYTKGDSDIFISLVNQLEFAKHNAKRALRAAEAHHTDNPCTQIHKLVEFLQTIKNA